jgi:hypothetical protein
MFDQEIKPGKGFIYIMLLPELLMQMELNRKDFWKGFNILKVSRNIDHCLQESR